MFNGKQKIVDFLVEHLEEQSHYGGSHYAAKAADFLHAVGMSTEWIENVLGLCHCSAFPPRILTASACFILCHPKRRYQELNLCVMGKGALEYIAIWSPSWPFRKTSFSLPVDPLRKRHSIIQLTFSRRSITNLT